MKTYPELEKIKAVKDKSQAIGEFLEWLMIEKRTFLAEDDPNRMVEGSIRTYRYNLNDLLAEFFKIDNKKAEQERIELLETIRKINRGHAEFHDQQSNEKNNI